MPRKNDPDIAMDIEYFSLNWRTDVLDLRISFTIIPESAIL